MNEHCRKKFDSGLHFLALPAVSALEQMRGSSASTDLQFKSYLPLIK